jgi:hypothetical protein
MCVKGRLKGAVPASETGVLKPMSWNAFIVPGGVGFGRRTAVSGAPLFYDRPGGQSAFSHMNAIVYVTEGIKEASTGLRQYKRRV